MNKTKIIDNNILLKSISTNNLLKELLKRIDDKIDEHNKELILKLAINAKTFDIDYDNKNTNIFTKEDKDYITKSIYNKIIPSISEFDYSSLGEKILLVANIKDLTGYLPIHFICKSNDKNLLNKLIDLTDLTETDKFNTNILMYLCGFKFYEEANKVFDKLENILGKKKFIKYLRKIDNLGNSLFDIVLLNNDDNNKIMYNKFLDKIFNDKYIGKNIDENNKLLVNALYDKNEYAIMKLINIKYIDLTYKQDVVGDTYLILAICYDMENIAEILINTKKIDLNYKNSQFLDALYYAKKCHMVKIILLISKYLKKSEIDIMDLLSYIPYSKLMKYENISIVQKVLKNNRNYQILNTKLKELSKIDTCPVCMDDKIITIPTECCHYYCKNCYINLDKCAICGYIINDGFDRYNFHPHIDHMGDMGGMQMGNMQMGNMQMGNMQMDNMQMGNMQMDNMQMDNMQMGIMPLFPNNNELYE